MTIDFVVLIPEQGRIRLVQGAWESLLVLYYIQLITASPKSWEPEVCLLRYLNHQDFGYLLQVSSAKLGCGYEAMTLRTRCLNDACAV